MPATIVADSPTKLRVLVTRAIEDNGPTCDLNHLDVCRVNLFSALFKNTRFNGDISGWNVSSGTGFDCMFEDSIFTGDISGWDTSNAMDMTRMFANSRFNGDIAKWNTRRLNVAGGMFKKSAFTGNISQWNTGHLVQTGEMFAASSFNGDVSAWDTSSLKQCTSMFESSPFRGEVANWDMQSVWHMGRMFKDSPFEGDVSKWNVHNVENAEELFAGCPFKGDLSFWDIAYLRPGAPNSRAGFQSMVDATFEGQLPRCGDPASRRLLYAIMLGGLKNLGTYLDRREFSLVHADLALAQKNKPVWMSKEDYAWLKIQKVLTKGIEPNLDNMARLIAVNYATRNDSATGIDLQEIGVAYI